MSFKPYVFYLIGGVGNILLSMASVHAATTTLIDPATLSIGARVGENLQVFGACPSSNKNCLLEEKIKYISAVEGRVGQIEFDVNLSDNFELDVNAYWYNAANNQTITLYKSEDSNSGTLYIQWYGYAGVKFSDPSRSNIGQGAIGWNNDSINNVELSAKSGTAYLNINGVSFNDYSGEEGDTVKFDTSRPFTKLVIANIQPEDKLYEITLKGSSSSTTTGDSSSTNTNSSSPTVVSPPPTPPTTTGTTTSGSSSTSSDGCGATYYMGEFEIPCVSVSVVGAFGDVKKEAYSLEMKQRLGDFVFDLDFNSIKQTSLPEKNACIAEYSAATGDFKVPCVLVPITEAFSNQVKIEVYDVKMEQQPGEFAFDLDLSSVKLKGAIVIEKQYESAGKSCTDIRVDEYDSTGTTVIDSANMTECK